MKKKSIFFKSIALIFNNSNSINLTGRYDPVFLILIFSLLSFGLVMLFSASFVRAFYYVNGNSFHYISRQIIRAIIGLVGMFLIARINYKIYKKFVIHGYLIGVFLLIIVLFQKGDQNGIKRWIDIGPIQFQPSEIMKIAIIMLFAAIISNNYKKMKKFSFGVVKFVLILSIVLVLMYLEPHLSGAVLICSIAGIMMFIGGTQVRWFIILFSIAIIGLIYIMFMRGNYMSGRAYFWLNPFTDPRNQTMQTDQSLLAIGSGGLFGFGLGLSRQKFLYLPEVQNDFIFAVICEELGAIGGIFIIVLFLLFGYRGFEIAVKADDMFGTLVCAGIVGQFVVQAIFNIAVVTSTVPNTGIALPFFSYGGTALVIQLWEMGIVLNISKHAKMPKLIQIKQNKI